MKDVSDLEVWRWTNSFSHVACWRGNLGVAGKLLIELLKGLLCWLIARAGQILGFKTSCLFAISVSELSVQWEGLR